MWHKKETVQPLTGYTVPYIEITSLWGVPKPEPVLFRLNNKTVNYGAVKNL